MSLLHHITGVHRWEENGTQYKCFHQDLSAGDQRKKKWLKVDSPAFKALQAVIMDNRLLKDLQQMTLFKHTCMQWRARGAGGAQAPAPLRSDAKVPLRSGLCDMNDIVDEISTAAVCVGHQVPGGHHPGPVLDNYRRVGWQISWVGIGGVV